jgi:GAF domain-containing protein
MSNKTRGFDAKESFDLDRLREVKTISELEDSIRSLDRTSAELATLGEVQRILNSSLDISLTANSLLNFLVPKVAQVATFDVRTANQKIRTIATRHVDPEKGVYLKELLDAPPRTVSHEMLSGLSVCSGKVEIANSIRPENLKDIIKLSKLPPNIAESLEKVGAYPSYVSVPMLLQSGEFMGVIIFGLNRALNDIELDLVKEIGSIAAQAIRNSELYESAKTQAEKLQLEREVWTQFIQKLSHDVKTPLTVIALAVEMLTRMGSNTKKVEELRLRVQENIKRISNLLTDSLDQLSSSAQKLETRSRSSA